MVFCRKQVLTNAGYLCTVRAVGEMPGAQNASEEEMAILGEGHTITGTKPRARTQGPYSQAADLSHELKKGGEKNRRLSWIHGRPDVG